MHSRTMNSLICTFLLLDFSSGFAKPFGYLQFLKEFFANPTGVGAIAPSSVPLAIEITSLIPEKKIKREPLRILEVGAGTGIFTEVIANKMMPEDRLDVIELEKNLCVHLKDNFKKMGNVAIHCTSIVDFVPNKPYDIIVSGLPFNAFDSDLVQKILDKYISIVKDDGVISYFEYIFISSAKMFMTYGTSKENIKKIDKITSDFLKKYEFKKAKVIWNIPPAWVHHVRFHKMDEKK